MEKKIDLEKIFTMLNPQDGKLPEWARVFCVEACRQTLKLAANSADLNYCSYKGEIPEGVVSTGDGEYGYNYISKESIINVINLIG